MNVALLCSLSDTIDGDSERDDVVTYRCMSCHAEFDLPKTQMVGVRCPDCHSMDVRDTSR